MSPECREGDAPLTVHRYLNPCGELIPDWDRLVTRSGGTDVTQLTTWARVKRMEGFSAYYLLVRRGRLLIGGAQILMRQVRGFGGIGYVPYGPLVPDSPTYRGDIVRALAVALARLHAVRMLFVQPPEGTEDLRLALLAEGFRPSMAGIAPTGSMRIDLGASEDDISNGLSSRLRYWTRRWPDRGVTVRRGNENDVPLLFDLMRVSARDRGYPRPPRLDYMLAMYSQLARTGNAALFVGEVHGMPVAADLVTMCGDMVRGRLGGFDRSGAARRLSVPAAVRWEITRWAKQSGYRWLDFGGLTEPTLRDSVDNAVRYNSSWPGPDRAKMAFGGVPFRYPAPVELIRPDSLRYFYGAATRSALGQALVNQARRRLRTRHFFCRVQTVRRSG
jgi:lipid II:glycine glycyltransferase (peptidoglycan interpeptide bridge formation enzyme)